MLPSERSSRGEFTDRAVLDTSASLERRLDMIHKLMFAAALAVLFVGGISTGAGGAPTLISRICSTVTRTVTNTLTLTVTAPATTPTTASSPTAGSPPPTLGTALPAR